MIACDTWSNDIYKERRLQVKDILEWDLIWKIYWEQKKIGGNFFEYF